jgi:uracil-DNA glycosylase
LFKTERKKERKTIMQSLPSLVGDSETPIIINSNDINSNNNTSNNTIGNDNVISIHLDIDITSIRPGKLPIPDDWSLERIIQERDPPFGWENVFRESVDELIHISHVLDRLGEYYPKKENLFAAFDKTPLENVRVILIGQDPYHQTKSHSSSPRAQGTSFSFARDDPVPGNSSLYNIFTEIHNSYPESFVMPQHGDLTSWTDQGVLLLNTCLTVRPGQAESHYINKRNIWHPFLIRVLNAIIHREQKNGTKPIFILLGGKAQELARELGEKVVILNASHPSPLSAHRGFFGSDVFKKANLWLQSFGQRPIDWNLYP